MKKKIIVLLLVLVSVLSGCGKKLDYDSIIDSFVSNNLNTFELTVGEAHAPGATIWLNSEKGSVYTSDESVVTVTELGKVTAVGEGTAYVIIGAQGNRMYKDGWKSLCFPQYADYGSASCSMGKKRPSREVQF